MFAKPSGINVSLSNSTLMLAKLDFDYCIIDIYFTRLHDFIAASGSSGFHIGCWRTSLRLIRQFETKVGDTLDISVNLRLRLHAEHGCDRRTQVVLIHIGGILCTRCKTRRQTHYYSQHTADCAIP